MTFREPPDASLSLSQVPLSAPPSSPLIAPLIRYVRHSGALFPLPLPATAPPARVTAVCARFRFLGRLMAAACRDGFIVPLPLSMHFLHLVRGGSLSYAALPPPDRNGGAPLSLCRCGGQTRPVRRCVRRRPDQRDGAPAQIRSRGGGRVWSIQIRHVDAFVVTRSSRSRGLRVSAHAGACAVECPCGADESRQLLTDESRRRVSSMAY